MDDLIATWRIHNDINLHLLKHLPEGGLEAALLEGMSVGDQLAHVNNVRVRWTRGAAPAIGEGLRWFEKTDPREAFALESALVLSGDGIAALVRECAASGSGVKDFPGSVTTFVSYLISHESHHRGQILQALKACGKPLDREITMDLWRGWWGRKPA